MHEATRRPAACTLFPVLRKLCGLALLVALALGGAPVHALAATTEETAISASAFADTLGVNVHLHYDRTAYYRQWEQVFALLRRSGVLHVRDGLIDTTWSGYYEHLNALGEAGIGATLIVGLDQDVPTILRVAKRVRRLDALEGPNEVDRANVPNWSSRLREQQCRLYAAVKADPQLHNVTVIAPALTSPEAFAALGDISRCADEIAMHDYFDANNPGTTGFGAQTAFGGYGSIRYNIRSAAQAGPRLPVVATETGYGTNPEQRGDVPEDLQGTYLVRLLLEHARNGVARTFLYEFLDEGEDRFSHFGLVTGDLRPKPAYEMVRVLAEEIGAPGAPQPPIRVAASIESANPNVHHLIVRRADGDFVVVLWLEQPGLERDLLGARRVHPERTSARVAIDGKRVIEVSNLDSNGKLIRAHVGQITVGETPTLVRLH